MACNSDAPNAFSGDSNPCPPSCGIFTNALPAFDPLADPKFTWDERDPVSFCNDLKYVYDEVVHWRKIYFKIPQGNIGKAFVAEMTRLYSAFADGSTLECIALRATIVLPILALQSPHQRSKPKEHLACLERRLKAWKEGDLKTLVDEGRTIQLRLSKTNYTRPECNIARNFANLMFKGKTRAAIDVLTKKDSGGVLHIDQIMTTDGSEDLSVKEILKNKHPERQPVTTDSLIQGTPPEIHPVIFDSIDARLIRSIALRTTGTAGPSGLDAYSWRRMCTAFKTTSSSLCQSLADVTKRLCSHYVNPEAISSLLACRLIALDKCPGVRPIGIGDTARRIIAKAVLVIIKSDIKDAAGVSQLCAGQISGCEAAVHSVREHFLEASTEAVLFMDASNAFNALNRSTALHNVRHLCPSASTILINTYRATSDLYIDGEVLYSQEGTTQGDPLAMPFYALATLPLIKKLTSPVDQTWYADDSAATGKIANLRSWWDEISTIGPSYGYYTNAAKTWLVVKPDHLSEAVATFADTSVNVTCEGRPYLGAAIGSSKYENEFVSGKVDQWSKELSLLSVIATSQPHAAFAAYTHGLIGKWSYLSRTVPNIDCQLQTLEDIIRSEFIPSLTGRSPPNTKERKLMALPARLGGLGITDPSHASKYDFKASIRVTAPLCRLIKTHDQVYSFDALAGQMKAKSDIRREKRELTTLTATNLREELPHTLIRAMDLASIPGSSSWLTSMPIAEHGFCLHKGAFTDALALRYGWAPLKNPTKCVCGASFAVEHLLSCPRGGFPSLRHNEIRDLTATLLTEVCNDVQIEPDLQEISTEMMTRCTANTTEGARLDIAASGVWGGRRERVFMDVRVFNPFAPSNRQTSLDKCFLKHEKEKKRAYEQRVREIENASFVPLVMSATSGMAKEATNFYKRLASLLAQKWDQPYSDTLYWLRCLVSFSLLRSAIQCIRGARSSCGHPIKLSPVDLVTAEARLRPE